MRQRHEVVVSELGPQIQRATITELPSLDFSSGYVNGRAF
jgi:hypothetical protein